MTCDRERESMQNPRDWKCRENEMKIHLFTVWCLKTNTHIQQFIIDARINKTSLNQLTIYLSKFIQEATITFVCGRFFFLTSGIVLTFVLLLLITVTDITFQMIAFIRCVCRDIDFWSSFVRLNSSIVCRGIYNFFLQLCFKFLQSMNIFI